ncbi:MULTISPECIES: hypothetical protein [Burkholderia cepacia complex]|nr:hypothetical protein [Burkholderia anthina]
MTENQSVIDENGMNNCAGKSLKSFADLPLTSRRLTGVEAAPEQSSK